MDDKERRAELLGRLEEARAFLPVNLAQDMTDEEIIHLLVDACLEAGQMIQAIGQKLGDAITDLQHMAGCPSCKHNRAPSRHTDIAICGRKHPLPTEGCYAWRGENKEICKCHPS